MKRVVWRFVIFALIGLLMEVLFGIAGDIVNGSWDRLRGNTSLWMVFDYGLLGVVTPYLAGPMKHRRVPYLVRAFVYMLGIFFVEYVSGILFHKVMGLSVWNYDHLPYNLHGQIALIFVVPWYLLGLVVEPLFHVVDAWAVVLARGLHVEDLPGNETRLF
ncbi:MAG: putative ABC transporter permease [Candidatus Hydrogenedentota bacterium]